MTRFPHFLASWLTIGLVVPLALGSATGMSHAQGTLSQGSSGAAAVPATPAAPSTAGTSRKPAPAAKPAAPAAANTPAPAAAAAPAVDASSNVPDIVASTPSASQATVQQMQAQPTAATVVTPEQLQNNQITNVQEAKRLEPSVQIKIINVRNIAIDVRGLGQASATAIDGIEDGVPVYLDGVYQARPGQALFDIPSLDSVTVAKGPQGTTGGADSTGGAIYLTTKLPEFKSQEYGEVSLGNYAYYDTKIGATGSILGSDKAAFRLDAYASDRNGYVSNLLTGQKYNDMRSTGVRAQILLVPNDDLTIRIIAGYDHLDTACCVYGLQKVQTTYSNGSPILNGWYTRLAKAGAAIGRSYLFIPPASTPYSIALDTTTRVKQEDANVSVNVTYNLNGFTLSSITAASLWSFFPQNDNDDTNLPIYTDGAGRINQKQASQEFRVESPHGQQIEYSAGVFSLWEQVLDRGLTAYGPGAGVFYNPTATNVALVTQALDNLRVTSVDLPITTEIAPYANVTYHVAPQFDLIGGLRYTYEWKSGSFYQSQSGPSFAGLTPAEVALAQAYQVARGGEPTATFSSGTQHVQNGLLTGLATLAYHITPSIQVYSTYSTGAKSGGLNLATGLPPGARARFTTTGS